MATVKMTMGDHFEGELTPEDYARLNIKEWRLSDDVIEYLEKLEASIVRPGDPRLLTIITG